MLTRNGLLIFALGIILAFGSASVLAQQKVYKWVDEEGVVHFSETPPSDSESVEAETLTTAKSPPYVPPVQPVVRSPAASKTDGKSQLTQAKIEIAPAVEETDIREMSLADLDRRCEDAREKKIAPLREVEIAKCKQQDPDYPERCERYYATYGDAVRSQYGGFTPRMFHDLPECVEAEQQLRERRR